MKINKWMKSGGALVALTLFFCAAVSAQEKMQTQQAIATKAGPSAYQASRETVITGKVLQFSNTSQTGPIGAHISLQTSSGTINVHAGNPKLLAADHLTLAAGDSVSITGENVPFGNTTVFVARVIQKGTQIVTVRNKNGMPMLPTARTADGKIVTPAGAR